MGPDDIASAAAEVLANIQARGHHLHLALGSVRTSYHSDEGASGEWIKRFFEGYFVPSGPGPAMASVYSTRDSTLFRSLQHLTSQRRPAEMHEHVELPLTGSVALVATKGSDAGPGEDVFRLLFRDQRVILLVTSRNVEVRREQGMQTVRSVMKWLLIEQGWIPMHSASVAKDGRAICIVGEKASGKTSTLLNLLARNGCDLVAIDKFLMRDQGTQLQIRGLPGKIGIRIGSAAAQAEVLEWVANEAHPFFAHMPAEEVRRIAATTSPEQLRYRKEKLHMLPTELAHLFGISITPVAPLSFLLVPVLDMNIDRSRLVGVDRVQATQALMDSYDGLLRKGEGFLMHFFDLSDGMLKERLAALLGKCMDQVRTYEVHQSHMTNEQSATLVAGLLKSER